MNRSLVVLLAACGIVSVEAQGIPPRPVPVFRPREIRSEESPVSVEATSEVVADNALYRRVETLLTFVNPNGRVFEGELELPLPEGATVCGYALDVGGTMVPGVVCEKEKARLAFDNERRKGVDPGVVEHVKGNLWKTRIYPLMPNVPRKARVAYIEPLPGGPLVVAEKDGDEVFIAERGAAVKSAAVAERLRGASEGWILWDASASRAGKTAADRNRLELLPEKGEWTLVVFRNVPEPPRRFTSRAELLQAVDAAPCDGGTSFEKLLRSVPKGGFAVYLFSDEIDTLSLKEPDFAAHGVVFASRPDAAARQIVVRKAAPGEKPGCEIKSGSLLATAWAANRIADLESQADLHKDEFLALGRKYGVASPVTSLIVLETLEQYLEHKIEPPAASRFHDAWVKRRASADDPIAAQRLQAVHEAALLKYWEERVSWWKDPIPKVESPKSGVFADASPVVAPPLRSAAAPMRTAEASMRTAAAPMRTAPRMNAMGVMRADRGVGKMPREEADAELEVGATAREAPPRSAGRNPSVTVKVAAWNPQMPYLTALSNAASGRAYEVYLRERDISGKAPSFYLDCAGWFFKAAEPELACRILSNLAEMRLEDVGLWRTMGWRLREAGACDVAVDVFRHVLAMRGEEPQSGRDLALVLAERGKANGAAADLTEAAALLAQTAFTPPGRKVGGRGRGGNSIQTCVMALEELNGLLSWCTANPARCEGFRAPELKAAYRRAMPLDLRIVLSWDTDETDVDLHVLEPNGEEAYYGHRRTTTGAFVSEDVTTGYGPEEYLKKKAEKGAYKVLANYFASHRQSLTGAATVTATVYTGWGSAEEKRKVLSFRLDRPKDKHAIGDIMIE